MSLNRLPLCRIIVALLLCLPFASVRSEEQLTAAQEANLRKYLPRTLAKLKQRETIRVAVAGDSVSAFYQPAGFPRYSSGMAWHGRMLTRLSSLFYYHGGVVDAEQHRDLTAQQKRVLEERRKFEEDLAAWERTKKGPRPQEPNPLTFDAQNPLPQEMSVQDLLRHRLPLAEQPPETRVIRVNNAARDGALSPQVLEALGTEIFPPVQAPGREPAPGPDLVILSYGVYDALAGYPVASYREMLERAVKLCRARGADVLLAAPTLIFEEQNARESLALTRPYAAAVRELAAKEGVFCVDLGAAMMREVSNLQTLTAEESFAAALEPVRRQFLYGSGIQETLNPNAGAAVRLGEAAARQLLEGPAKSKIEVSGWVETKADGEPVLTIRAFNGSDEEHPVAVNPLGFTGFRVKPGIPDACFILKPGKAKRLTFPGVLSSGGRMDRAAGADEFLHGAVLVTDDFTQEIADISAPLLPVAVVWPLGRIDQASGDVLVTATLVNNSPLPQAGTAVVEWNGETRELPVKLEARQRQTLPLRLKLPDAAGDANGIHFRRDVVLQVKLADRTLRFSRTVEGARTLGLEERIPLTPLRAAAAEPAAANAWVQAGADRFGLYLTMEAPASLSPRQVPGQPWAFLDVQLDGRKPGENGEAGFVDRLSAEIPLTDGKLTVKKPRPAVFGNGYFLDYNPESGFAASVSTRPDGRRRIEFSLARVHLPHHEWSLDGSGQNTLGFNVRLSFPRGPGAAPEENQDCQIMSGVLPPSDPRSLAVLELSRRPAARWSVRIF